MLLDERGLKKEMIGKDCQVAADGQVSKMMGSAEEAERFLALLERKVREVVKMPEMWNNMENCSKKSPEGVWSGFKRVWTQYS